jgi:hypothetical protein
MSIFWKFRKNLSLILHFFAHSPQPRDFDDYDEHTQDEEGAVDEEDDEIKGSMTRNYYTLKQKETKTVVVEGRELFLPSR